MIIKIATIIIIIIIFISNLLFLLAWSANPKHRSADEGKSRHAVSRPRHSSLSPKHAGLHPKAHRLQTQAIVPARLLVWIYSHTCKSGPSVHDRTTLMPGVYNLTWIVNLALVSGLINLNEVSTD